MKVGLPSGVIEIVEMHFGEVDEETLALVEGSEVAIVDLNDGLEGGVDARHLHESHPLIRWEELDSLHWRRGGGGRGRCFRVAFLLGLNWTNLTFA